MQSVPSEFVSHLRPLMYVAGLGGEKGTAEPQQTPPSTLSASSPVTLERETAFADLTTSLRSVLTAKRNFALYESAAASSARNKTATVITDFHVVLVEKSIRLPPRKARLNNNQTGPHSPISPFSPTSPLYPDGIMAPIWIRKHRELVPSVFVLILRLYEFGYSNISGSDQIPSPTAEKDVGPLDREKIERDRDTDLINEILFRKRTCAERGVKLAVVLLTSREMLDDPTLELRLSYIRRTSTLDSRASLFVLSPVPISEVTHFVASLKSELLESSIDYYREHGRRLRRKRSRPANSTPSLTSMASFAQNSTPGHNPPVGDDKATSAQSQQSNLPQPLSNQALNVRYEYKAAAFAEFRGELEVALKHYEDCYLSLVDLFISPPVITSPNPQVSQTANSLLTQPLPTYQLQPRTKRWAEARVLADTLNIKICKLYLYDGNASSTMSQYHHHLRRFASISSEVWHIDSRNFEYWSWESKQHRMFAELLESALKNGYKIPPLPGPIAAPPLQARAAAQHTPDNCLQHPGYYYFIAGLCAQRRRECFTAAAAEFAELENEPSGLRHERTIPHSAQIIELFTHAYEHFKKHKATRATLHLADQISSVHALDGNKETVMKFDERIGKTYRKEGWQVVLDEVLGRGITVSQNAKLGGEEQQANAPPTTAIQPSSEGSGATSGTSSPAQSTSLTPKADNNGLLKMLFERITLSNSEMAQDVENLLDILSHPSTTSTESFVLDSSQSNLPSKSHDSLPTHLPSLKPTHWPVSVKVAFWKPTADLGTNMPFQIQIDFRQLKPLIERQFLLTSIHIYFNNDTAPTAVTVEPEPQGAASSIVDVGVLPLKEEAGSERASLCITTGKAVISGAVTSSTSRSLEVTKASCEFTYGNHTFIFDVRPSKQDHLLAHWLSSADSAEHVPLLLHGDHTSCTFQPRKLNVAFQTSPTLSSYVNESFPIALKVANNESFPVSVTLDALLHPLATQQPGAMDILVLQDNLNTTLHTSSATISSIEVLKQLGPHTNADFHLHFTGYGSSGPRHIETSVIFKAIRDPLHTEETSVTELSQPIKIEVVHPFFLDFNATFFYPDHHPASYKAKTDEPDVWRQFRKCRLNIEMGALGPTPLLLHSMRLNVEGLDKKIKLVRSSHHADDGQLPAEFVPDEPYSIVYELELSSLYFQDLESDHNSGIFELEWSRDDKIATKSTKTFVPLPPFIKPRAPTSGLDEAFISAELPSHVVLHNPFSVIYRFTLPPVCAPSDDQYDPFRPRNISYIVESASENFVFSGVRKVERLLFLPEAADNLTQVVAKFTLVAIGGTGLLEIPKIRIWEILDTPQQEQERRRQLRQQEEQEGIELEYQPRMCELAIVKTGSLISQSSEGGEGRPNSQHASSGQALSVYVVPH